MDFTTFLGTAAAIVTTAGYVPQAYSNGITAALAGIMLGLKLTAKPTEEPVADGGHPTK